MDDTRTNCQCHVGHNVAVTRIISVHCEPRIINPRIMIIRMFGGFYSFFIFLCFTFLWRTIWRYTRSGDTLSPRSIIPSTWGLKRSIYLFFFLKTAFFKTLCFLLRYSDCLWFLSVKVNSELFWFEYISSSKTRKTFTNH